MGAGEVGKLKPWLRFVEGDEGGSATDDLDNVDDRDEQDDQHEDQDESEDESDEEVDWKAKFEAEREHSRKWEQRAKSNMEKLKKLEGGDTSDESDGGVDPAMKAIRYRVALDHGLSRKDAELFLVASDEAALEEQAKRLAELTAVKKVKRTTTNTNRDRKPPAPTLATGAELYARTKNRL